MKKRWIYLILIWVVVGCQREEEVDLEIPFKRKLAGFMFIGNDMIMLGANALFTRPVTGPADQSGMVSEPGINITLQRGNYSANMVYEPTASGYLLMMPDSTKPGQTYQITFAADGEQSVGTTTLPQPVSGDIQLVKMDSIDLGVGAIQYNFTFSCKIKTPGKHYLQLLPSIINPDSSWASMSPIGLQEFKLLEGGETFNATFNWYGTPSEYLVVRILTADEAYAKYYNTVNGFSLGGLGPFSEPQFAYSNMSAGVGVVASYSIGVQQYVLTR